MYTCHVCGKPTPNYHEWRPSVAAILGEQGESTCGDPSEYDDEEDEIECPECGRTFEVEIATVRTYRTRRRREDMPHGWNGGEL